MATYLTVHKALAGRLLVQHSCSISPFEKLLGVVSFGDPGENMPEGLRRLKLQGLPVLRQEFHDLDYSKPIAATSFEYKKEELVQEHHIQEILDWNEKLMRQDGTVLVHCHAGACRSAAATYIMLYQKQYDYAKEHGILDLFSIQQPFQRAVESCINLCWPNKQMLGFASGILDVDFLSPIQKHYDYVSKNFQFHFI